jgi:hypothetical protein
MIRTLEAAAYWKLRALCSEAQRLELVAVHARETLAAALKKQTDALAALELDPRLPSFTLDDDTCTITVPEGTGSPP